MPIVKKKDWLSYVEKNKDPYGKAIVDVARKVMEILDEEKGDFDTYDIIHRADKEVSNYGLTGFMAGCIAQIVSHCHSRGEEFRKKWNISNQIRDEGEKANESGGVLNPAILTIKM